MLTPGGKSTSLTRSKFGTIDVSPAGNKLLFGNYTSKGNNICYTTIPETPMKVQNGYNPSSFLINKFDIKPPSDTGQVNIAYNPEPYRKWQHLFRFHSWMPFYADITELKADPASIRPGVSIMTQNTLSTFISTFGYEYSIDHRNVVHSRITWKGWYPVIESQLDYGTAPVIKKSDVTVPNPTSLNSGISFLNTISLPLQFSSGRFSQFIQPSVSVDYLNQYIYFPKKDVYDYGQTIITGRVFFSNYDRSSIRDIYPRWAQVIDFNYCLAPFDNTIYGSTVSLKTAFYFPGILPNNSLKIRLEAEKQHHGYYLYTNFSTLPRGYYNILSTDIRVFSVDYVLPLIYPDLNVASLLYVKRIRAGLFYDYATGPGNSMYKYTSGGLAPLYNTSEPESFKSFEIGRASCRERVCAYV
jgi:hypothetical protein